MINLIEIDEYITKINNTYNTKYDYKIVPTNKNSNHFANLKITNDHSHFEGWWASFYLYYDVEFCLLNLYDSLVESWVEKMYED